MTDASVGSIVRARNREWVVVPSDDEQLVMLRPLTGGEKEICGIFRPFITQGIDPVEPATFPYPDPAQAQDAASVVLFWNAARLTLRDGAAPFRSLGKVSLRPRSYQFVPLLMALRLDPIRLLIADDVGVGKTIEALLIVRELLDRGEIKRLCVVCPPYLCDQWQQEMSEKFQIDAKVIRSGTINQLQRDLPYGESIFRYYPYIVVSIDFVKLDKNKHAFLSFCPECVIIDEAHGAARPAGASKEQQKRYDLLQDLATRTMKRGGGDMLRHLILLTATPHSGHEESFKSLLGLLKPVFETINLADTASDDRIALAQHYVQRRRVDIATWPGDTTPFPERISDEAVYSLSPEYSKLFSDIHRFSREMIKTGETLSGWSRRIRYWTVLALLRCVMSSPAAAEATLKQSAGGVFVEEETEDLTDELYSPFIYESSDDEVIDAQPGHIIEQGEKTLAETDRSKFPSFVRAALKLSGPQKDTKLAACIELTRKMITEGHSPIIWCRYIATAHYVAEHLQKAIGKEFSSLRIIAITGEMADEERRSQVDEFSEYTRRVLVATDCLSEGINLQKQFNAVIHYDLPWNPNRLEQREGRVDRFGQEAEKVRAVLLYGKDNLIDIAVLEVLLRKAKEIRRTLGVTLPVPMDSETVMQAVLQRLFFADNAGKQMTLIDFLTGEEELSEDEKVVSSVHKKWDRAAEQEKLNRTRFAQRAVKPEEIMEELVRTDKVLGDPHAVRIFIQNALQRLGIPFTDKGNNTFDIGSLSRLPEPVRKELPDIKQDVLRVTFISPGPEAALYLGRNHPAVAALAGYLFEEAVVGDPDAVASRCGVIRTKSVSERTILLLLRVRYTIKAAQAESFLAEEVLVRGFTGSHLTGITWMAEDAGRTLLADATPSANVSDGERKEVLSGVFSMLPGIEQDLLTFMQSHGEELKTAHKRVRKTASLGVKGLSVVSHPPPDPLGIVILLPDIGGKR
jgi:superfamily II DNA or RNA helicase